MIAREIRFTAARPDTGAVRAIFLPLVFFLSFCPAFAQSESLREALNLEKTGEKAASIRIYKLLIARLPPGAEFYSSFEALLRLESDVDSLVGSAHTLLGKAGAATPPHGLAGHYAVISELAGDLETAAGLYRMEYDASGSEDALRAAIALAIEMNDLDTADILIPKCVNSGQKARFQAEAAFQKGDSASAQDILAAYLLQAKSSDASLAAMSGSFSMAAAVSDREGALIAAERLAAEFPLSPEAVIATAAIQGENGGKARIYAAPVPAQFLVGAQSTVSIPSAPAPEPNSAGAAPLPADSVPNDASIPAPPKRNVSVQAGSYLVRENAEDMVKVLREKGFSAVVREQVISGRTYFKALAATSTDISEAKKVLEDLRAKGFDGVLVFD
jgi:cell division septation protein DedD